MLYYDKNEKPKENEKKRKAHLLKKNNVAEGSRVGSLIASTLCISSLSRQEYRGYLFFLFFFGFLFCIMESE